MYKISLVIPTYNRCESVRRALEALLSQTLPAHDFEVIVSIDGSEDGTLEMVSEFESPYELRYVWGQNEGKASACNRAIDALNGEIVVMIDDDMEPTAELLKAHYESHQKNPRTVVIGAAPIELNGKETPIVAYIAHKFNTHLERISQPGFKIRIWDFYGGNFSIDKKVLSEVGNFDESYKVYGFEDVEFANRLLKSDVKLIYSSDAKCIQYYVDDYQDAARKMINSGKNAIHLISAYPETFTELKLIEYNFTGWKWRSLRMMMIRLSMLMPFITNLIIYLVDWVGKYKPHLFVRLNGLAMDYFFWLGVWIGLRTNKDRNEIESRIKSYQRPQDV
ncbi:MAG TPA: glycosyltransferase family 2 protein [Thermodesulfobacteriota bacterium]|nr:glycosyltransferase family 2 protein [Thermodesulfobacteriota bacterium]